MPSAAAPDADRTVLVPRPGGRAAASPDATRSVTPGERPTAAPASPIPPPSPSPSSTPSRPVDADVIRRHGDGLNPLVRAANPLLDLVVPLRYIAAHPNMDELRHNLVHAIKNFETEAKLANLDPQAIAVARYALCTFLDETIASTPWGGGGAWASKSLLVAFHNEAWGGEKFFQILQRLAQEPVRHLHLLELMYLCLALGLEGRYRVIDDGRSQIESLRERLYQMIRTQRGAIASALSVRWLPSGESRNALFNGLPIWGIAAAVAALTLVVRMSLIFSLNQSADPLLDRIERIEVPAMVLPSPHHAAPAPQKGAPAPTIAGFLAPEVAYGLITVSEKPHEVRIILHGEGVFASGSAVVNARFNPLLDRIGDALKTVGGNVLVIGHTDDQLSRDKAVPTNEILSAARANTVLGRLAERAGGSDRFRAEGRGAREPLAANDSAVNRARNRRVEIVVVNPNESE